ncbi:hypothetical protein AcV5_001393 [Taiwanofungus camphoratus]|nr:hypothetical protein AcV5_001393 [Antrodia cinnamomea]
MTVQNASIIKHTTASSPRPHVLYIIEVISADGQKAEVARRYSEFVDLHNTLGDPGALPPKRILVTSFLRSAWVDDKLIAERKEGLNAYLASLLQSSQYITSPALLKFLTPSTSTPTQFNPEDALPSTLSRRTALQLEGMLSAASSTPIAAAYYPDWASNSNPPQNLDFSKFGILLFAFATPNSSSTIDWDDGATSTLQTLVSSAHNSGHDTKIVLSIGGWGGSHYFSQAVGSSSNRSTFVKACVNAVNTYNLDGIDIDWEYPGQSGAGNLYASDDSANLLTFFKDLRSALGQGKIISAAVTDQPWQGSDGNPLSDVSAYAEQMTYANIMCVRYACSFHCLADYPLCRNYDVWGASSTPGPNAPLSNACGNSQQPQYSAQAAFNQWTAANFPASQLVLGLPLYGYVSKSTAKTLEDIAVPPPGFLLEQHRTRVLGLPMRNPKTGKALACVVPQKEDGKEKEKGTPNALNGAHPRMKGKTASDVQQSSAGDLSSYWGQQIPFNQIVALGALKKQSDGTYVQNNGYTEGWDNCSDTPYLFDTARTTVITYDDTYSLGDKATFAKNNGMAGCFTWSLDQDDGYTLQDVIRSSLGL